MFKGLSKKTSAVRGVVQCGQGYEGVNFSIISGTSCFFLVGESFFMRELWSFFISNRAVL